MNLLPPWMRNQTTLVAVVVLVVGVAVCATWIIPQPNQAANASELDLQLEESTEEAAETTSDPTTQASIVVYISGAVHAPDVYVLPANARVKDAVVAAGGLTDDADAEKINLAARISDEQHIQVAWRGTTVAQEQTAIGGEKIDLNTASAADLDALPGVGVAYAERILEYRNEHGGFKQVEELQEVKGIAGAVYDKIASLVQVGS